MLDLDDIQGLVVRGYGTPAGRALSCCSASATPAAARRFIADTIPRGHHRGGRRAGTSGAPRAHRGRAGPARAASATLAALPAGVRRRHGRPRTQPRARRHRRRARRRRGRGAGRPPMRSTCSCSSTRRTAARSRSWHGRSRRGTSAAAWPRCTGSRPRRSATASTSASATGSPSRSSRPRPHRAGRAHGAGGRVRARLPQRVRPAHRPAARARRRRRGCRAADRRGHGPSTTSAATAPTWWCASCSRTSPASGGSYARRATASRADRVAAGGQDGRALAERRAARRVLPTPTTRRTRPRTGSATHASIRPACAAPSARTCAAPTRATRSIPARAPPTRSRSTAATGSCAAAASTGRRPTSTRCDRARRPDDGEDRGLHFICVNANIARQFEFVQRAWVGSPKFAALYDDADPLIGRHASPRRDVHDPGAAGAPARDRAAAVRDRARRRVLLPARDPGVTLHRFAQPLT